MIRAAIITMFAMLPLAAQAGGWDEFEARCVDAYENLAIPVVAGLTPLSSSADEPGYAIDAQQKLVIELVPDDGESACRLEDRTGLAAAGFDRWIAGAVKAGRYVEIEDNSWHSHEWIEPVLGVQKRQQGDTVILRILVTDLES